MDDKQLINLAFEASKRAYNPYSHFAVGACVYVKDGSYIQGCNIENAAYGSSMCAERNAVYSAYCQGYQKDDILALAIVSDSEALISPCGACRQVLAELLNPQTPVLLANKKRVAKYSVESLLPLVFTKENMSCSNQDL